MLSTLFSNPIEFLFFIAALLIALTIHEFFHAYASDRLGDPTARLQGRVSLNPKVHLDFYGMLFLLLAGFGWGKPVQYDPFNLKNPRKDGALIAFAGPASNLILALVLSFLLRLLLFLNLSGFFIIGIIFIAEVIKLNVMLGLFNLIPIYPLDGFTIVSGLLSREKAHEWEGLRRYGIIFLFMFIIPLGPGGSMLNNIIQPIASFLINLLIPSVRIGAV